jgi:hypothetical protein
LNFAEGRFALFALALNRLSLNLQVKVFINKNVLHGCWKTILKTRINPA